MLMAHPAMREKIIDFIIENPYDAER